MSLDLAGLGRYLVGLTTYVERWGVEIGHLSSLDRDPDDVIGFVIEGRLPATTGPGAEIILRERWSPDAGRWERSEYAYELIDHELASRRAFHQHDSEAFIRRFRVVVHEHCEGVLGSPDCLHYAGLPVLDGYDGARRLLAIWVDPGGISCDGLTCLEA